MADVVRAPCQSPMPEPSWAAKELLDDVARRPDTIEGRQKDDVVAVLFATGSGTPPVTGAANEAARCP